MASAPYVRHAGILNTAFPLVVVIPSLSQAGRRPNRFSLESVNAVNPILARYNASLPFSVQERDIDLLLIEQLHVCGTFAEWLTERLGLSGVAVETVRHSVYREHGETDVLLIVRLGDEYVAVMIEDKIGAPMQPDQMRALPSARQEALRGGCRQSLQDGSLCNRRGVSLVYGRTSVGIVAFLSKN